MATPRGTKENLSRTKIPSNILALLYFSSSLDYTVALCMFKNQPDDVGECRSQFNNSRVKETGALRPHGCNLGTWLKLSKLGWRESRVEKLFQPSIVLWLGRNKEQQLFLIPLSPAQYPRVRVESIDFVFQTNRHQIDSEKNGKATV